MKTAAIILIILCIAALVCVGFLCLCSDIEVVGVGCLATDPLDVPDYFQMMTSQDSSGALPGTRFTDAPLPDAAQCKFLTYTVRLKNNSFLKAESVEVQVTPMSGDLIQLGDTSVHDLKARSTGDIQAVILTGKENHNIRELTVTYYIWGIPFTVRTTSGQ